MFCSCFGFNWTSNICEGKRAEGLQNFLSSAHEICKSELGRRKAASVQIDLDAALEASRMKVAAARNFNTLRWDTPVIAL